MALLQIIGDEGGHRAGRAHVGRSRVRRGGVDAVLVYIGYRSKAVYQIRGYYIYFPFCIVLLGSGGIEICSFYWTNCTIFTWI